MMAPFSKCYGKISVAFCLTQENVFSQRFRFKTNKRASKGSSKNDTTQPAIACSKLAIETLEQGVKYVQS